MALLKFTPTKNTMSTTILNLEVENVKRIQHVTVTPHASTVIIGGRNGQGKSSLLDAISMALGGKNEVPSEPLRKGQKKGFVVLKTQELIVTRTFTPKGSVLEVTNPEGLKFPSPQAVLDKLCTSIAFDPLAFIRADKKTQLAKLMELVGVNPLEIDAQRKAKYEARTAKNRDIKAQEAVVLALPDKAPPRVEVADLLAEMEAAQKHNAANDSAKEDLNASVSSQEADERRIAEMHVHYDQLKQAVDDAIAKRDNYLLTLQTAKAAVENNSKALSEKLKELFPAYIDIDEIKARIQSVEENNRLAAQVEKRKAELERLRALTNESEALTAEIATLDQKKVAMLADAKFPVPGLSFDETGVLYNELPLDQASSAEQLRIGLAIACQMNPSLKVMLIRDGSLLDDDSLKIVEEMAAKHEAQVWIERVGNDGKCTVVIEDGTVLEEAPGESVAGATSATPEAQNAAPVETAPVAPTPEPAPLY